MTPPPARGKSLSRLLYVAIIAVAPPGSCRDMSGPDFNFDESPRLGAFGGLAEEDHETVRGVR